MDSPLPKMPSKKKKFNARFPPARIKKIMQTDEEIGKVAAPVPVIISKALELFVQSLAAKASIITRSKNAKTLTSSHLKSCVLSDSRFSFLKNMVANVPDVQGDDDLHAVSGAEGNACSSNSQPYQPKRRKSRGPSSDSAGPSRSTADESETCSAEEDGEDSENSCSMSISDHPHFAKPPESNFASPSQSASFSSSSHTANTTQSLKCVPHNRSNVNDDDDYDS